MTKRSHSVNIRIIFKNFVGKKCAAISCTTVAEQFTVETTAIKFLVPTFPSGLLYPKNVLSLDAFTNLVG